MAAPSNNAGDFVPFVLRSCQLMSREQSRRLVMADETKSPFSSEDGCFAGLEAHALEIPLSTYTLAPWGDVVIDKSPSPIKLGEFRCGTRTVVLGVNHPQLARLSRLVGGESAVSARPTEKQHEWGELQPHEKVQFGRKAHPLALSPEIVWDLAAIDPQIVFSAALARDGQADGKYVGEHTLQRWVNDKQSRDETCAVGSYSFHKFNGCLKVVGDGGKSRAPLFHSFALDSNDARACDQFTKDVFGFLHSCYLNEYLSIPISMHNQLISGEDGAPANYALAKCRLILRSHVVLSFSSFLVPQVVPAAAAAANESFTATQIPHLASLLLLMALFGVQHESTPAERSAAQLAQLVPSLQTIIGGVVLDMFADLIGIYASAAGLHQEIVHTSMCQVFAEVAPRVLMKFIALDLDLITKAETKLSALNNKAKSKKDKKTMREEALSLHELKTKKATTKVLQDVCAGFKSGTTLQLPCMCRRLPGGSESCIAFTML